jgi:hypothetical protein
MVKMTKGGETMRFRHKAIRGTLMALLVVSALSLSSALERRLPPHASKTWATTSNVNYRKAFANFYAVYQMAAVFASIEGRGPGSWSELMSSPYAFIREEDLINPYTGRPMQKIPLYRPDFKEEDARGWPFHRVYPLDKNNASVPYGEYSVLETPSSLIVVFYNDPTGEGQEVEETAWRASRELDFYRNQYLGRFIRGDSTVGPAPDLAELNLASDVRAYGGLRKPEDIRLALICWWLGIAVRDYTYYYGRGPANWEELAAVDFLHNVRMRNPYTGAPIQVVPFDERTRHPGDIAVMLKYDLDGTTVARWEIYAYSPEGKRIFPFRDVSENNLMRQMTLRPAFYRSLK